jgi:hypothetical protein
LGEKTTRIDTAKATKTKCITPHRYHCTTVAHSTNRLLERRHYGKTIFGENGIICRDETLKGDEYEESYTCHRVGFCVHVRIFASGCIGGCLHG